MRVMFAIDTLASGGAQRQAVELAVRLVQRGQIQARFTVYHPDGFFRARLDAAGIDVTLLPKRARYDPLFPRRLRADLVARPVDVVHAFLLPPSLWSMLAVRGLPRLHRPALIAAERNELIGSSRLELALQRFAYRRVDRVTVNASPVAPAIEQRCGVPAERIRYIPNGIDLEAWDREMLRPCALELEPGLFHVGIIGRIAHEKHHELLLEALERIGADALRGWRIWVIGAGAVDSPAGLALQARARAAGLAEVLRFLPPQQAIASIIARLSLVVLSSRNEGFPNVVLEAMASGVPVVSTRVGDVPRMLEDGVSGRIVPPGDATALANALLDVYRMQPERRRALGLAGRARVEREFHIDRIADRYLDLYAELTYS